MKCHYWCLVWYCCDGLSENAKCLEHLVIWCQIWWFGARSGDLVPNLVILCQIWWSEPNIPWDLNQPIEQRCDLPGDKDATNMIQALTQIFFWFGIVPTIASDQFPTREIILGLSRAWYTILIHKVTPMTCEYCVDNLYLPFLAAAEKTTLSERMRRVKISALEWGRAAALGAKKLRAGIWKGGTANVGHTWWWHTLRI